MIESSKIPLHDDGCICVVKSRGIHRRCLNRAVTDGKCDIHSGRARAKALAAESETEKMRRIILVAETKKARLLKEIDELNKFISAYKEQEDGR